MSILDRLIGIWKREHPDEPLESPRGDGFSRRRFLGILGTSAAVAAAAPLIDLERLVWTPGAVVAVPDMGGMLVTADWLTREAMRILTKNLEMVSYINRKYDGRFALGDVITIDTPAFGTLTRREAIAETLPVLTHTQGFGHGLPISAHTNKVVLAQEGDMATYGIINGRQFSFSMKNKNA